MKRLIARLCVLLCIIPLAVCESRAQTNSAPDAMASPWAGKESAHIMQPPDIFQMRPQSAQEAVHRTGRELPPPMGVLTPV